MHGFTNYEQSKALFEHGYRHPKPIDCHLDIIKDMPFNVDRFPSFSLADLITMQGAIYHVPANAPMNEIIQSYVDSALHEGDTLVQQSNQRLKEAYK
jgi:hypothetical protein